VRPTGSRPLLLGLGLHVPENRQTPAHTHTHKEADEAERLMSAALETWSARSRGTVDAGHARGVRG